MNVKKLSTVGLIAGLVIILPYAVSATAAVRSSNDVKTVLPKTATIETLRALESPVTAEMSQTDYNVIKDMLSESADDDQYGNAPLVRTDLFPVSAGRTLLKSTDGHQVAAVPLKGGQICYTAHVSHAQASGCVHEMISGVASSGGWTSEGEQIFGLVVDGVTQIEIKTNKGSVEKATLDNNAFWWNSDSPSRGIYASEIIASFADGTSKTIQLPNESSAAAHAPR